MAPASSHPTRELCLQRGRSEWAAEHGGCRRPSGPAATQDQPAHLVPASSALFESHATSIHTTVTCSRACSRYHAMHWDKSPDESSC